MFQPRRSIAALVIALGIVACATRDPGDPLSPGYNVYSPEQDIELGRQAAAEVRQQVDVVDDPRLQNYIKAIGQRLAEQPDTRPYPYEFTLINEDSINAFALPGGPVFVHSGLIEAADNEAQVAGVLAHEIGHVALRHGTSQASKSQMVQLPALLAGMVIGDNSALAQLGQLGLGLGVNSLVMKYSREAEKEADALGARIMALAGYDPLEMARFFEKLAAEGGSRPPIFLSSHPDPGNRTQLVQAEMQAPNFPQNQQFGYRTGNFDEAKQLVAQLPEPKTSPQMAQATAPPSAPSGDFRTLRARTFALAYPSGWQTYGNQSSNSVAIAPQQGLVRTSRGGVGIGYGAVLAYYQPRSNDLGGATQELISELRSINPTLRTAGGSRQVTVSGNPGLLIEMAAESPYGGVERNILLTVARPEGLFYMVFVAPENNFAQVEPAFEQMVQSIRFAS